MDNLPDNQNGLDKPGGPFAPDDDWYDEDEFERDDDDDDGEE